MKREKIVIIGSGPAAYTAAIYAARSELSPVVYEGFYSGPAGGQLMTTTEVENYPGFPEGIGGAELMGLMRRQAERFGTVVVSEDVREVDLQSWPFTVRSTSGQAVAFSLIIATGAQAKRLDVPGTREHELWQKGVTACAVCDGAMPLFRNQDLFVIGGGDTAMEEALFLTKFARHVFIVHRRDSFRASKIMAERVLNHPKITVLWNRTLASVQGADVVQSVTLENVLSKEHESRPAGGVFFAIGHTPNTAFLRGQLECEPNGYLRVIKGTPQTSIPGVFAAGDVQDPHYRQAVTAAGSGCMAALEAERWLGAQQLPEV